MSRHLLLYASRDGQTEKIARVIEVELKQQGLVTQCHLLSGISDSFDLEGFGSILIGSPIRYGHHLPEVQVFIRRHTLILQERCSGFFSVNLTARKRGKDRPETNPYLQKFFRRTDWKPGYTGVMAGALLYSRYRLFDRLMIQLIMKITGGNTDARKDIDYANWLSVNAFARGYADYLKKHTACEL